MLLHKQMKDGSEFNSSEQSEDSLCQDFLDSMDKPDVERIMLIKGGSVLHWPSGDSAADEDGWAILIVKLDEVSLLTTKPFTVDHVKNLLNLGYHPKGSHPDH